MKIPPRPIVSKASGIATPGFQEANAIERLRRKAEDVRLLYVATTRARDEAARTVIRRFEQLTVDEASLGAFAPMPVGTKWGAKWEYGWFKGTVTLPDRAAGKRIVLKVDVGAENLGHLTHGRGQTPGCSFSHRPHG